MGDIPELSIVIPVYNDVSTLERAVKSCLSQGGVSIEVIVVDDASTDGTGELAERLAVRDQRMRVIHHGENLQLLETRRTGVLAARGSYVLFLDGDDVLDEGVCCETLALARETGADIVHFSIIPCYGDARPDEQTVTGRARAYAARDLTAEGSDVLHVTYRDNQVVWSLCGKLYERELLLRSMEEVPRQRMFQCEDAFLYFVVARHARRLVSSTALPAYRYSIGGGDTHAEDSSLTTKEFASICQGYLAADNVAAFLDTHDDWGEFGDDYNALYDRLTAGPISCYPSRVAQEDRAACYDVLVNDWPVEKVISWLAVYNWEEPALSTLLDAVEGSGTLARRTVVEDGATALMSRSVDTTLLARAQALVDADRSVVLLLDEWDEQIDLPAGVDKVIVPASQDSLRAAYSSRAATLTRLFSKGEVCELVHLEPMCPTFAWDVLLARTMGIAASIDAGAVVRVISARCAEVERLSGRVDALRSDVARVESERETQRVRADAAEHAFFAVTDSVSFRAGRAMTAPARALRDRLHGGGASRS